MLINRLFGDFAGEGADINCGKRHLSRGWVDRMGMSVI